MMPPKALIVISLSGGLVFGHVVPVRTGLVEQTALQHVVVRLVVGVVPVVKYGTPSGAGFPPVIGADKHTWGLTGVVTVVIVHKAFSYKCQTALTEASLVKSMSSAATW